MAVLTTGRTPGMSTSVYLKVRRKISVSLPTNPTAAQAIAIDWGEISLPMIPPVRLADTVRIGFNPSCPAVTCLTPFQSR